MPQRILSSNKKKNVNWFEHAFKVVKQYGKCILIK